MSNLQSLTGHEPSIEQPWYRSLSRYNNKTPNKNNSVIQKLFHSFSWPRVIISEIYRTYPRFEAGEMEAYSGARLVILSGKTLHCLYRKAGVLLIWSDGHHILALALVVKITNSVGRNHIFDRQLCPPLFLDNQTIANKWMNTTTSSK